MRITNLTLQNFRSFGESQTIDFAPVTLLFGPNSVGKSTVLMALFYVQQILAKGQCDPQRIEAMGDRFVGGFRNLVRGKQLDQPLVIGIAFEIGDELGSSYTELGELVMGEIGTLGEAVGLANYASHMSVDLDVRWSETRDCAYVSDYRVFIDHELMAVVSSDPGLEQPMITELRYQHRLLESEALAEWVDEQITIGNDIHPCFEEHVYAEHYSDDSLNVPKFNFSDEAFQGPLHEAMQIPPLGLTRQPSGSFLYEKVDHSRSRPLGIKGFIGAIPKPGQLLHVNIPTEGDFKQRVAMEILSDILVAPLDNLLKLLNDSLCIGPLRHVADSTYQPNAYPDQKDWYSGKACWDALAKIDPKRDSAINRWMDGDGSLNLGYKLLYKISLEETKFVSPKKVRGLEIRDTFAKYQDEYLKELDKLSEEKAKHFNEVTTATQNLIETLGSAINRDFRDLDTPSFQRTALTLWDQHNDIEVAASDIGVGVSQLLPLVVAAMIEEKDFISCEQPELHVHPRVQVGIGDLLLSAAKNKSFLIETHSEHLVLRLLRRVRETTEGRLPEGMDPVRPEDISIVYLEPGEDGVSVRHIEVDEDGEFKQRWPHGFFPERREELL